MHVHVHVHAHPGGDGFVHMCAYACAPRRRWRPAPSTLCLAAASRCATRRTSGRAWQARPPRRSSLDCTLPQPRLYTAAASTKHCRSLYRLRVQALSHAVAGSITYIHMVAGSITYLRLQGRHWRIVSSRMLAAPRPGSRRTRRPAAYPCTPLDTPLHPVHPITPLLPPTPPYCPYVHFHPIITRTTHTYAYAPLSTYDCVPSQAIRTSLLRARADLVRPPS